MVLPELSSPYGSLIKQLKCLFGAAIKRAYNFDEPEVLIAPNPKKPQFFQCNNAFKLAKLKITSENCTPGEISKTIAATVRGCDGNHILDQIQASDQGAVHFSIAPSFIEKEIVDNIGLQQKLQCTLKHRKRICIDFSSPNIAKDLHVGHLRSTIHGESLARVYEFLQCHVTRLNHIGDWGTQFGMLIEYIKDSNYELSENSTSITDLNNLYKLAKKKFDADEDFKQRSRKRVTLLQSGDTHTVEIWQQLVRLSEKQFSEIYAKLEVRIENRGESFYNDMIPDILKICEEKGVLQVVDGATCLFIEHAGNKTIEEVPLILVKSDGGFGYDTTDLAAIHHRLVVCGFESLIYVTDKGQDTHFIRLFEAAKKLQWLDSNKELVHVKLGLVCDDQGKKFKTRSGEPVRLIDLMQESVNHAREIVAARRPELPSETRENIAEAVGYGALKYFDMNQHCSNDYKFSYEKMLDLKGNTAVYLLYTYARMCSILIKLGLDPDQLHDAQNLKLQNDEEKLLGLQLLLFPDALTEVLELHSMHKLCMYTYKLATAFSQFYDKHKIISSPEQNERVALVTCVIKVMKTCFHLLGIKPLNCI